MAFIASSTIPAIYIKQFWDTMCFNSSTGLYSCQLDEQWFNLHKYILKDALGITPANDNIPFEAPPSSDTIIEYVNTLGYPNTLRNISAMSINALYQPWRYQRCLDEEHGKAEEEDVTESPKAAKATKSKTAKQTKPLVPKASKVTKPPKPTPTTTEPSKKDQKEDIQQDVELSIKEQAERTQGPVFLVVIKGTDSGEFNELGLIDSEKESDKEGSLEINAGTPDEGQAVPNPGEQDEGHARPNPGIQDEGQAGSNPGDAAESHAENLKLLTEDQVILKEPASSAGTLSSLQTWTGNSASPINSLWRNLKKMNLINPILKRRISQ
ncbi:hypothetical protein Tco_0084720 [Tanacetum coccineum]